MLLKQYYLGCLAHASYLIAAEASGQAAVVDPQRDVGQYVEDAARLGCWIGHVFLTHLYADFVAGHLELRDREGARIYLGAGARAEYPFVPMADGAAVRLGTVRLEVLQTPGHSPESISILVYDSASGSNPYAVLTGTRCSSATSAGPTYAPRLAGAPSGSPACCTTRCIRSWRPCRTRRSCIRRTATAHCAART